jgi:hypothetical protein
MRSRYLDRLDYMIITAILLPTRLRKSQAEVKPTCMSSVVAQPAYGSACLRVVLPKWAPRRLTAIIAWTPRQISGPHSTPIGPQLKICRGKLDYISGCCGCPSAKRPNRDETKQRASSAQRCPASPKPIPPPPSYGDTESVIASQPLLNRSNHCAGSKASRINWQDLSWASLGAGQGHSHT